MRTIWKYPVPIHDADGMVTDRPVIEMPEGAQILTVQTQYQPDGESLKRDLRAYPMIWVLVNPDAPKVKRQLLIVGTGHRVPEDIPARHAVSMSTYVGTWQEHNGGFIFHLFDLGDADVRDRDG